MSTRSRVSGSPDPVFPYLLVSLPHIWDTSLTGLADQASVQQAQALGDREPRPKCGASCVS